MTNTTIDINPLMIKESIRLLKLYITDNNIEPLISLLEAIKQNPKDNSLVLQVSPTLNKLGITQGAVLTYAPYLSILLSDNLFADD